MKRFTANAEGRYYFCCGLRLTLLMAQRAKYCVYVYHRAKQAGVYPEVRLAVYYLPYFITKYLLRLFSAIRVYSRIIFYTIGPLEGFTLFTY